MVPMFTCGLLRSNFSLAIASRSSVQILATAKSLLLKSSKQPLPHVPAFVLFDDFLRQRIGHFRVVRKVHGEVRATLRAAAQIRGVTKHLRKRNFRANHVYAGTILGTLNR